MPSTLTDEAVAEAFDICASEPVHIPGSVQPFACLLAFETATQRLTYVSANADAYLQAAPEDLLASDVAKLLGTEVWHAVKNALASGPAATTLGSFAIKDQMCTIHAFQSAGQTVIEIEKARPVAFAGSDAMKTLGFLMQSLEGCTSLSALFDTSVRLLRHLSGYDRVMIYRFDRDFNGEVLAEDRLAAMSSFLGLRFPHWDIPAQARAMMMMLPIRIIEDVDQVPVPLLADDPSTDPLDISLAACRGVSPVHMEYLRNMGVASSMTLTIKTEGELWGIISFHHGRPHVPAPDLRDVLANFGQLFATKLQVLEQAARLQLVARVDAQKDSILDGIEADNELESFAKVVFDILDADGIALTSEDKTFTFGNVPEPPLLSHLQDLSRTSDEIQTFENLAQAFPTLSNATHGCAGALLAAAEPGRTLCIFRTERTRDITWAGNPEKTIEDHDGRRRLSPRGSFSTYLEQVSGYCAPWSEHDKYFASRIWSLVNSAERRELQSALSRQQQIMIDELNHRVRNILALVRSVSQQARRSSYGSLESYSRSLEARIQALAASHDLASGGVVVSVLLAELLTKEFAPYSSERRARLIVKGTAGAVHADVAPIFSLVIHELVTNAVKYGALSNDVGTVTVTLLPVDTGLNLHWTERGGPPVKEPDELGFGSTLIKQAIPHELNGKAALNFEESGVTARFFLPSAVFQDAREQANAAALPDESVPLTDAESLKAKLATATCLLVEDNFVIAEGMRAQLEGLGVGQVEIFSRVDAAEDYLSNEEPSFAILDMNLGAGATSEPLAHKLHALRVPFFFVTGYGESGYPGGAFSAIPNVTKPALTEALLTEICALFASAGDPGKGAGP